MLPQWHIKDPGHSAKSAGGRLHLNMHTPLTQWCRSGLTMRLSRHTMGTYPETIHKQLVREHSHSHQLTEPLWTDPGLKSGVSVHKLISTYNNKKSTGKDRMVQPSPKTLARDEKATTSTPLTAAKFDALPQTSPCTLIRLTWNSNARTKWRCISYGVISFINWIMVHSFACNKISLRPLKKNSTKQP